MEIGARLEDLGLELPVLHCTRVYLVCIMLCITFEHTILLVAFRVIHGFGFPLGQGVLGCRRIAEEACREGIAVLGFRIYSLVFRASGLSG